MKPKTDRRIYRTANILLMLSIAFIVSSMYLYFQPQIDGECTFFGLVLASIYWVGYVILKEIGMMFDELKDKPKSDKEEGWLRSYSEREPNRSRNARQPLYTKVEIAGRLGKNAGRKHE